MLDVPIKIQVHDDNDPPQQQQHNSHNMTYMSVHSYNNVVEVIEPESTTTTGTSGSIRYHIKESNNPNYRYIPLLSFVTTALVVVFLATTTTTLLSNNNNHHNDNQQLSNQFFHHHDVILSEKSYLSKMDIKRRLQNSNDDDDINDDENTNGSDDDDGTADTRAVDCEVHNLEYKEAVITPGFYDSIYREEMKMININERSSVTEDNDENGLVSIEQQSSSVLKCHQTNIPVRLSGKKGIGLGVNPLGQAGGQLEDYTSLLLNLNVQWSYNWRLSPASNLPDGNDFLPMVFSVRDSLDSVIDSLRVNDFPERFFDGSVHTMLGFNEPDATSATVESAIDRWNFLHQYNIPLVSPSCVNPLGDWMKTFMQRVEEECKRVDYIGVHWYGSPNYENFINWLTLIYSTYNIPIIITEFAPADWRATTLASNRHTPEEVLNFMKSILPWLERTEFIVGYSWFSFIPTNPVGWSSSLFDTSGNLSVLGQYYQSVTPSNPDGDLTIQF